MEIYRTPEIKWQYQCVVFIDGHQYSFGDREPIKNLEDAQAALTYAVETHESIPVNILGPLKGEFETPARFEGTIKMADDLPDGSDLDPETKRDVKVTIICSKVRQNTVFGD